MLSLQNEQYETVRLDHFLMKKFFIAFTILSAGSICASAEGYQVNTLSAKQNGMGHTGVALKLGSESQIFNPAGLAWLDDALEISGSFTAIFPTATAKLPDGSEYKTDNKAATPLSANVAFSIYDDLKAGVSFYTPYGSSINWTDNWPGAVLNQSVTLKTFTLQPTLAWKPSFIKGLSVGAGLMMTWGSVDLNKGIVTPSSLDKIIQASGLSVPPFGNTVPASVNLSGTADVAVGANVGVMYDINDSWTVGFSYRSKMVMKVQSGMARLKYANTVAEGILESQLGVINQSQFKAEMPCAAVYSFGVSYRPVKPLVICFDAQLTGWNAYKQLDIEFLDSQLEPFNQHIEKNYHNSWTFHLGAEYSLTERFDLRAGLMVDTTPVNKDYYNPETPGMTKIEPSAGFSFRPLKNFSIDAAFLYIAGTGIEGSSCPYVDLLASKIPGESSEKEFVADYSLHAFIPSIGFTLSF